jgi:hypothetical protein
MVRVPWGRAPQGLCFCHQACLCVWFGVFGCVHVGCLGVLPDMSVRKCLISLWLAGPWSCMTQNTWRRRGYVCLSSERGPGGYPLCHKISRCHRETYFVLPHWCVLVCRWGRVLMCIWIPGAQTDPRVTFVLPCVIHFPHRVSLWESHAVYRSVLVCVACLCGPVCATLCSTQWCHAASLVRVRVHVIVEGLTVSLLRQEHSLSVSSVRGVMAALGDRCFL